MELGGGIFYGYVVVDVPLLVSNLTGCERDDWLSQELEDARNLLQLMIRATAQVTPGAKLGATAPYARADFVLLEVSKKQPRSLANAFLEPINNRKDNLNPMSLSVKAIAEYMGALDDMYGKDEQKRFVSIAPIHKWPREDEAVLPLEVIIDQSLEAILGEQK
jgi:CRISPR system Cascade subunit CasC